MYLKNTKSDEYRCPICMMSAIGEPIDHGAGPQFDCSRCGKYGVADFLMHDDGNVSLSKKDRSMVGHLLAENCLKSGPKYFLATTSGGIVRGDMVQITAEDLLEQYPKTPLEHYDRALLNVARLCSHPADRLYLPNYSAWPGAFFGDTNQATTTIAALVALKYLSQTDHYTSVTPSGWARIAELRQPGRDAKQAFVAMWFDPSMVIFYNDGFKPAIEADGKWGALRIDRKDFNNKIDDEIVAEIRRSRFLVADFTDHRGGVYYEAGLAAGIGLPVIFTCRKDHIEKAHFDTRQFNHIVYEAPEELRAKLLNRIRATII